MEMHDQAMEEEGSWLHGICSVVGPRRGQAVGFVARCLRAPPGERRCAQLDWSLEMSTGYKEEWVELRRLMVEERLGHGWRGGSRNAMPWTGLPAA